MQIVIDISEEAYNEIMKDTITMSLDTQIDVINAIQDGTILKQGKWQRRIVDGGFNANWVCSECKHRVYSDYVNFKYCPNCGADMRGGTDG